MCDGPDKQRGERSRCVLLFFLYSPHVLLTCGYALLLQAEKLDQPRLLKGVDRILRQFGKSRLFKPPNEQTTPAARKLKSVGVFYFDVPLYGSVNYNTMRDMARDFAAVLFTPWACLQNFIIISMRVQFTEEHTSRHRACRNKRTRIITIPVSFTSCRAHTQAIDSVCLAVNDCDWFFDSVVNLRVEGASSSTTI